MYITVLTRHEASVELIKHIVESGSLPLSTDDDIEFEEYEFTAVPHWDGDLNKLGDVVIGVAPLPLISKIIKSGREFYLLTISIPPHLRGKDLGLAEIKECGYSLARVANLELEQII